MKQKVVVLLQLIYIYFKLLKVSVIK